MKKSAVIIVIFITTFAAMKVEAQTDIQQTYIQQWVQTYAGPDSNFNNMGSAIDANGNEYVAGVILDTTHISAIYHSVVLKYDPLGNLLWSKIIPKSLYGSGVLTSNSLTVDNKNNIYLTGAGINSSSQIVLIVKINSIGTIKWTDTLVGIASNAISVDPNGNVYIAAKTGSSPLFTTIKYDSNGTQQWIADYYTGSPTKIVTDNSGNVYVTGTTIKSSSEQNRIITIKYNSSGAQQWVADTSGDGTINGIALDSRDNVYITGTNGTSTDYITIKYNGNTGAQLWLVNYNGTGSGQNVATAIVINSKDNITVTGSSEGSVALNYATVQYDSSGSLRWAQQYSGPNNNNNSATAIAIDVNNNIYVTGNSSFTTATIKYNNSGDLKWIQNFSGNGIANANGIAVDADSNVYITGYTNNIDTNGNIIVTVKYTPYNAVVNSYDTGGINTLLRYLKSNITGDIQSINTTPNAITIYSNSLPNSYAFENIKGISVFTPTHTNDSLLQKLYLVSDSSSIIKSKIDITFNSYSNFYYLNDLKSLTPNVSTSSQLSITFNFCSIPINTSSTQFDGFGLTVLNNINKFPGREDGDGCGECAGDGVCAEVSQPSGESLSCNSGGCLSVVTNTLAQQNPSLEPDTMTLTADRNFRDNFMSHYAKGQQYITFYYKLNEVTSVGNTITLSNFVTQIELAFKLEACAHSLQYGSSTDIPISTSLHDAAIAEIATYRSVTTNPEYQMILDQIEKDFNRFVGQTRGQIISYLNTNKLN